MTYQYNCDGFCNRETIYSGRPALTAEFNEQFFESTRIGGQLAEHEFEVGDLITLCPECTRRLLIDFPRRTRETAIANLLTKSAAVDAVRAVAARSIWPLEWTSTTVTRTIATATRRTSGSAARSATSRASTIAPTMSSRKARPESLDEDLAA